MNKPQYLTRISLDPVCCLGEQLLQIITVVKPFVESCIWYGVDVELNGYGAFRWGLQGRIPKRIGDINRVIDIANNSDQFLCGVFFAVPYDLGEVWNREFSTEDEPFRDMEEAILEIRAFDTTYFEVYSNQLSLMKLLAHQFASEVLTYGEESLRHKKALMDRNESTSKNMKKNK